jgi:hypothetical protein
MTPPPPRRWTPRSSRTSASTSTTPRPPPPRRRWPRTRATRRPRTPRRRSASRRRHDREHGRAGGDRRGRDDAAAAVVGLAGKASTSHTHTVADLGTGTPASGKYLDGAGAWTTLPSAQSGAGQVTIAAGAGVTLRTPNGAKTAQQWSQAAATKRGTNDWIISGDTTT